MSFNVEIKNRNGDGESVRGTIADNGGQTEGHGLGRLDTREEAQRILDLIPDHDLHGIDVFIGDQNVTTQFHRLLVPSTTPSAEVPSTTSPSAAGPAPRTGSTFRGDVRTGAYGLFGHGPGLGVEVPISYMYRLNGGRSAIGGEVSIGGVTGLSGDQNSEMSGFRVGVRAVGSHEIVSTPRVGVEVRGGVGMTVGNINSPDDRQLTAEELARIGDAGGGARGTGGAPLFPTDLRAGDRGFHAGGLTLNRTGMYIEPNVLVEANVRWTPGNGSVRLHAGPWATMGYGVGSVSGHNPGDDSIPVSGVNWGVGVALGVEIGGSSAPVVAPPPLPLVTGTRDVPTGEGVSIPAPSGGWPAGARVFINGTERSNLAPSGHTPLNIPASALRPGENTVEVKVRGQVILRWTLRVPIIAGPGMSYGALPRILATTTRPPLVAGSPPAPISVGSIQTSADLPAHSTYRVFVDGNPVGSRTDLLADRNTPITIPASVTDGTHQVHVRVYRGGTQEIIYPVENVTIAPATNFAAAPSIDPATSSSARPTTGPS